MKLKKINQLGKIIIQRDPCANIYKIKERIIPILINFG